MNTAQALSEALPGGIARPASASAAPAFPKYELHGAYHYRTTFAPGAWRRFDPRLAARYLTAVKLLAPQAGDLVLDAGSGEGVAALLCCRRGARTFAVELDAEACRLGEAIARREGFGAGQLFFWREDLCDLSLPTERVDKIISLEVIEHMDDVPRYLGELHRVLKPGGRLVLSTPLKRPDGRLHDRYHVQEFDFESLKAALSRAFRQVEVFSCWTGDRNRRYESNRPCVPLAKLRRTFTRLLACWGRNPFVGPVAPDPECGLMLARAVK
jgi:SAM-dependent methyltransferase